MNRSSNPFVTMPLGSNSGITDDDVKIEISSNQALVKTGLQILPDLFNDDYEFDVEIDDVVQSEAIVNVEYDGYSQSRVQKLCYGCLNNFSSIYSIFVLSFKSNRIDKLKSKDVRLPIQKDNGYVLMPLKFSNIADNTFIGPNGITMSVTDKAKANEDPTRCVTLSQIKAAWFSVFVHKLAEIPCMRERIDGIPMYLCSITAACLPMKKDVRIKAAKIALRRSYDFYRGSTKKKVAMSTWRENNAKIYGSAQASACGTTWKSNLYKAARAFLVNQPAYFCKMDKIEENFINIRDEDFSNYMSNTVEDKKEN